MTEPRPGENQPPPPAGGAAASTAAASNTAIPSIDSGDDDLDDVGLVESTVASAAITTTEGEPEAAHAQERHDKADTSRIDDYDTDDGLPPMPVLPGNGRRKEEHIHVPHHAVAERSAAGPTTSDDGARRHSQLEEKGSVYLNMGSRSTRCRHTVM